MPRLQKPILEKWQMKPIPNFPDYFADEQGNIYSMKPPNGGGIAPTHPRKLKPCIVKGYYAVNLYNGGKHSMCRVHQLILTTFVSPRPKDMQACHGINGQYDNSLGNLYYATAKQNAADKYRDGTERALDNHPFRKLNMGLVRAIRKCYAQRLIWGTRRKDLAEIFNVHRRTIQALLSRETWNEEAYQIKLRTYGGKQ